MLAMPLYRRRSGGALVRELEDTVEGLRRDLPLLIVDGGRARVGDRRAEAGCLRGLEDSDRAGHVNLRADYRPLAHERHLHAARWTRCVTSSNAATTDAGSVMSPRTKSIPSISCGVATSRRRARSSPRSNAVTFSPSRTSVAGGPTRRCSRRPRDEPALRHPGRRSRPPYRTPSLRGPLVRAEARALDPAERDVHLGAGGLRVHVRSRPRARSRRSAVPRFVAKIDAERPNATVFARLSASSRSPKR